MTVDPEIVRQDGVIADLRERLRLLRIDHGRALISIGELEQRNKFLLRSRAR